MYECVSVTAYVCICVLIQKQFGMDGSGGYRKQIERNMERAVSRGNMGPAEFHQKRAELMESLATGVDDGKTRTQGLPLI